MQSAPPKLYRIAHNPHYFYAGHLRDDTQVFIAHDWSRFLGIFFDTEGMYLKHNVREFSPLTRSIVKASFRLSVTDEWFKDTSREAIAGIQSDLDRWVAELGSQKNTIAVQKFSLPEHDVSIHDLFLIYEEMIADGEVDEETEMAIEEFRNIGFYVFVCFGKEFEIDAHGELVST